MLLVIATCIWFVEYARRGSLYDFIRSTREPNAFTQILQWAKDVALGKVTVDSVHFVVFNLFFQWVQ